LKIISIFLLWVGQMQLFDYLFWTNNTCGPTNKFATKMAILFNHLQPIILYFLIWFYKYPQSEISTIIILLYVVFVLEYTIKLWPDKNCDENNQICCSLPVNLNSNEQIINWGWNSQSNSHIIYGLFIASLAASSFDLKENKLLFASVSLISFFISNKIPKLSQSIGRLCVILLLLFLVLY